MSKKIWLLTSVAVALVLFGIQTAGAARAAEFHCSVEPCRLTAKADGTGKNAHHVITVNGQNTKGSPVSVVITCEKMTGEGEAATKTSSEILIHPEYTNCKTDGIATTPSTVGCFYSLGANGKFKVVCEPGAYISFNVNGCIFSIGGQVLNGVIPYNNLSSNTETTARLEAKSISGMTSSSLCDEIFGMALSTMNGWEYNTGNVILTGESTSGVMGSFFWL